MQLATGFALAGFLIMITGGGERLLNTLGLRRGYGAALLLLLAILSTVTLDWGGLSLHPASLILYAVVLLLSRAEGETVQMLLTAGLAGIGGFFLFCLFRDAAEPGLILMLPGILLLLFPGASVRGSLYGALLAPLVIGLWLSLEESCLFERFYLQLGSGTQLDAALATLLTAGCIREFLARALRRFPSLLRLVPGYEKAD